MPPLKLDLGPDRGLRGRYRHVASRHGPIIRPDFPLQTASNALSQSVCQSAQMFGPLTVCPRFMSQGAPVGAEGRPYHAADGSFVSGAIPEDEASGGRTAGSQESKICCSAHKGRRFGGPALNEPWPRRKTRAGAGLFCVGRRPFECHRSRLRASGGQTPPRASDVSSV